jgi:outer membrane receptor for ferrienterochelin and colicins
LTGARKVVITETLKPERSTNVSVAYAWAKAFQNQRSVSLDVNLFYGYFQNRILPDYTTDANAIYYANLNGYAENRGVNLNCDAQWGRAWRMNAGITWTDHRTVQVVNGERHTSQPFFTERWSGAWTITYQMSKKPISFDYSGNLYSPMLLPLLGPLDPRSPTSPWWSIQNIQCTYRTSKGWEIFGGVKNLLNWTPLRNNPFLIARSQDPFDKQVTYNDNGEVVPTADNPYALTFDPSYVYAPNQGIRCFLGIRFQF